MAENPIEEDFFSELTETMKVVTDQIGEDNFINAEIFGIDHKQAQAFFEIWVQLAAVSWLEKCGLPFPFPKDVVDISMKCFLMGVVYARRELGKEI